MPLFEITKPITATLVVECATEKEAMKWADKIVAAVEEKNGNPVQSQEIISFDADVKVSEILIKKLKGVEVSVM